MSATSDFLARLVADATLAAAVGTDGYGGVKVYSPPVPQEIALPFVVVRRTNETAEHDYSGASALTETRYAADCYGTSALEAQTLADNVRNACDGYRGTMGSTVVRAMFVESRSDELSDPGDGSEDFDHLVPVEVVIWHERSVPSPS